MLLLLAMFACTDDPTGDSGPLSTDDTASEDTGPQDTGPQDTGPQDTGDGPVDADGDGYTDGEDCDDSDPAVHPGATEVCDGRDNDCDASTTESGVYLELASGGIDYSAEFSAASPANIALLESATLHVCPGRWTGRLLTASDLSVVGHGGTPEEIVLDAVAAGTLLSLRGAGNTVQLSGLTLENGATSPQDSQEFGGGAYRGAGGIGCLSNGARHSLTLDNVRLDDNLGEAGGAITLESCDLSATGVELNGSQATVGGAIFALDSNVELTDSSLQENSANTTGGAIHMEAGSSADTLILTGVTMALNTAVGQGGAVRIAGGVNLDCSDSSFTYNLSRTSLASTVISNQGGGILSAGCSLGQAGALGDNGVVEVHLEDSGKLYQGGDNVDFACDADACTGDLSEVRVKG